MARSMGVDSLERFLNHSELVRVRTGARIQAWHCKDLLLQRSLWDKCWRRQSSCLAGGNVAWVNPAGAQNAKAVDRRITKMMGIKKIRTEDPKIVAKDPKAEFP